MLLLPKEKSLQSTPTSEVSLMGWQQEGSNMSAQDDYTQPDIVDSRPPEHEIPPPSRAMNRAIIGAFLVIIGLIALVANVWRTETFGLLVLPALGIIFLVAAFVGRISGLLIPGSILTGLGLGTLAQQT